MKKSFTLKHNIRKSFGKIPDLVDMPNLLEIQRNSYDLFLQRHVKPEDREEIGLQAVFKKVFPITDFSGIAELRFVKYELEEPRYDVDECIQRGGTYGCLLKVTLNLVVREIDEETGASSIKNIKEQEVYLGDMPLMTGKGTFVFNGTTRVVVSQMHRSPGVFFDHDKGKSHSTGKFLFASRLIPYNGSWIDFEFDGKDLIYVRIDKRRKILASSLLLALDDKRSASYRNECIEKGIEIDYEKINGMTHEELFSYFYKSKSISKKNKGWEFKFNEEELLGTKLDFDLVDSSNGKVYAKTNEKFNSLISKQLKDSSTENLYVENDFLIGKFLSNDIYDKETGIIFFEAGDEISDETLKFFEEKKIQTINILNLNSNKQGSYIRDTFFADKNKNRNDAVTEIYKILRPGEPPTIEAADKLFKSLFFHRERYDLSPVGRLKINTRLGLKADLGKRVLENDDLIQIIKYLAGLKDGNGHIDDIDHLGNRRVRSVGELLENQYTLGVIRMERAIKERMTNAPDIETVMPNELVNPKPASAAIREFFGQSQLSQFMDQTNPLSEITHKRRLSALGPGGLSRERAGFEVRDVHPSHYGRICPIETPEGPNIGLINSLATYSKVNNYGFIETPYRKVENSKVSSEIVYLSAMEEEKYTIAQANEPLNADGSFQRSLVSCRKSGDFLMIDPTEVNYIDVSPKQLVSVAAALIPFLENDDANRALMGSNMMRQAVPLLKSDSPYVGTGMESVVARDSGVVLVAKRSGYVNQVDASRIVISAIEKKDNDTGVDIYRLSKFQRSNQDTCINQTPLVREGDYVEKGDIIADGPASKIGELALGKNVTVAFMPWNGYNYEDSILISENLVVNDVFTSIHIQEFEVLARDTKLGQEEITRDIPNVGEESLVNLDEAGIIHIGAKVNPGDILVGKVTPKGESPMTPEEKLLRAIFGEKAADVKDTSLKLPPGVSGTVVEVRVFSRRGVDKDERSLSNERMQIEQLHIDMEDERFILESSFEKNLKDLLLNQTHQSGIQKLNKNSKLTEEILGNTKLSILKGILVKDDTIMKKVELLNDAFKKSLDVLNKTFQSKVDKVQSGDELLPGVMKLVKVFVAVKRQLAPGDKMAGRHGNKGVISRIIPVEDMPYMEDGTPVDIVLNPLGVPSRMNVGQILETHLGAASVDLGKKFYELGISSSKDEKKLNELKTLFNQVYGDKIFNDRFAKLKNNELIQRAINLRDGVPFATPVFDGAKELDINNFFKFALSDTSGQKKLVDGRTGSSFDRKITVGQIYMLKLNHLVDDKIHARSIGPYSLVTQQPLGGKAQFGGQRFGEMEVWALEAYGASYTLQEMLTVKSDDVAGRTKAYETIVRGDDSIESGIPESFNVLIMELKSLGLNVELLERNIN
ncbi:MAG: DNA-directed RNA polymerase subunit beta [Rickettsiales bacterium]|nr:DNA-directed RNA polymerase subunit beta [Rickettsiales bacterium]